MNYALQGGVFAYYPDSAQSTFTNYWLEDTDWIGGLQVGGAVFSFI